MRKELARPARAAADLHVIVLLTGVYKLKDFLIRERFFVATHKNIKI